MVNQRSPAPKKFFQLWVSSQWINMNRTMSEIEVSDMLMLDTLSAMSSLINHFLLSPFMASIEVVLAQLHHSMCLEFISPNAIKKVWGTLSLLYRSNMCAKISIIATLKRLGMLIRCRKDNVSTLHYTSLQTGWMQGKVVRFNVKVMIFLFARLYTLF